jgi:pyruvate dehydrogenase E2 component (dihydrolipoamide acetyltransferase)
MAIAVNMPQIGQDIDKGVIREWYVGEGDKVEEGDILATVESEKAAFEVEALDSGTLLKILYEQGQEAEVFKPIAYIGVPGERIPEALENNTQDPIPRPAENRKIFASPSVKRLAREHNITLDEIRGSGPEGRIIKRDLLPYLEGKGDQALPFSPTRKSIARRLTQSKQNIPHFYLSRNINVTWMLSERKKYNDAHTDKLSINDLIIYAVASSLREFPKLNAHVQDTQIILKGNINIGIAVIVENGLLVPVIPDADRKSLNEISHYSEEIIQKAQQGIMQGGSPGSFTLSNLGMYGISEFQAIINPPESAILAVGNAEKKAVPGDQGVEFADYMAFGLACDHRVIDGAYGALFLANLTEKLENLKI